MENKDNKNINNETETNTSKVEKMLDAQSAQIRANSSSKKRKFFDVDLSLVALLILALGAFGLAYAMQQSNVGLQAMEIIGLVILDIVLGIIVYNAGKILFGYLTGYRLSFISFLGICIYFKEKVKVTYDISYFFELRLSMVPRRNQDNPKPLLMFLGGIIFFAICAAVVIGISFMSIGKSMQSILFYSIGFASLIPIYELLPLKYGNRNDMFLLIFTSHDSDQLAYNNYLVNRHLDRIGENCQPIQLDSYDNSRVASWTILPNVQNKILEKDYPAALKLIELAEAHDYVLPDYQTVETGYAKAFCYIAQKRTNECDDLAQILNKKAKNAEDFHPSLATLRTMILMTSTVENSLEATKDAIQAFVKKCDQLDYSPMCKVNLDIVNSFIPSINSKHPDWKLQPVSFSEAKAKREEKSSDDEY